MIINFKDESSYKEVHDYLKTMVNHMAKKFYPEVSNFRPLEGDLWGMVSQIDNMTTGLQRADHKIEKICSDCIHNQSDECSDWKYRREVSSCKDYSIDLTKTKKEALESLYKN